MLGHKSAGNESDTNRGDYCRRITAGQVANSVLRARISIAIVHSRVVRLVDPLHQRVECWGLIRREHAQKYDRRVEYNEARKPLIERNDLIRFRVDCSSGHATCFFNALNLFRLHQHWLAHVLGGLEAHFVAGDYLMSLFDLRVGVEEKKWI